MKALRQFMMRVRQSLAKDIKRFVSGQVEEKTEDLTLLLKFLGDTISFCEQNLYVDKPIEAALPLFEILKMIQDLFGAYEFKVKLT